MTEADRLPFGKMLLALGELFDAALSQAKLALYFRALEDLSLPQIEAACGQAVKGCKFMPKPAELRMLVLGDPADRIERAWLEWRQAARRVGSYGSLETGDATLAATLDAMFGGWPEACLAEFSPEMWTAKRKEFGRIYSSFTERKLTGPRCLSGICARTNELKGYALPSASHPALAESNAEAPKPSDDEWASVGKMAKQPARFGR